MTFKIATRELNLFEELKKCLDACGQEVELVQIENLDLIADAGGVFSDFLIELEDPNRFDELVERLFGSPSNVAEVIGRSKNRPFRFPMLLIQRTEAKPIDQFTVLGEQHQVHYIRWRLSDMGPTLSLTKYDLYEPLEGRFIDLLQTGVAVLRVQNDADHVEGMTDGEQLAMLAKCGIVAAQFHQDKWESVCLKIINRIPVIFDDDILLQVQIIGLGYGLAITYKGLSSLLEPRHKSALCSAVEDIEFNEVLESIGVKQSWGVSKAKAAWSSICLQLTRIDRKLYYGKSSTHSQLPERLLTDLLQMKKGITKQAAEILVREKYYPDGDPVQFRFDSIRKSARILGIIHERSRTLSFAHPQSVFNCPPDAHEILRDALLMAKTKLPELFEQQYIPVNLRNNDRLVAVKVEEGYVLTYGRGNPKKKIVKEDSEKRRKSRILIPLMEKMASDIGDNIHVEECGWTGYEEIEQGSEKKMPVKFRTDLHDLRVDLESIGLKIIAAGGRLRLDEKLAADKVIIIIKP